MPKYQIYFDTNQGEKRFEADLGDDEPVESALRDILVELSERGYMLRGLSTGDLKVIWGGREGRELDLARTLPEQDVRPNDVLRVLVDSYEAGGRTLRADRIDQEWKLLSRLAAVNPERVEILDRTPSQFDEVFHVGLHASPGIASIARGAIVQRNDHTLRLSFPRFYPEVPIECYIEQPLFHPNVKPETGFVCLWEQANPRDTVIQALARAQAIAAYRMVNMGTVHLMNRMAAEWYGAVALPQQLVPLSGEELKVFHVQNDRFVWLEPGRGLARMSKSRLA